MTFFGIFFLHHSFEPPKDIERLTLLKSIHIFKKHRVQYEMRTHYRCIEVRSSNLKKKKLKSNKKKMHKKPLKGVRYYSPSYILLETSNLCIITRMSFVFVPVIACHYKVICLTCLFLFFVSVAASYNRLYSTSIPWIHSEESSRRCSHGGDEGEVLQRSMYTQTHAPVSSISVSAG